MEATTDAKVEGVRNHHDIDVLVTFRHSGLDLTWIVECKHWQSRVSKLHVLALRQIVEDVGADRGILLAESGFQSGAISATRKSNVYLTNMTELQATAADTLDQQRLLALPERIDRAKHLYWSLSKSDRIDLGIRSSWENGDRGYRGQLVLPALQEVAMSALAGEYPPSGLYSSFDEAWKIANRHEAIEWMENELTQLEAKLNAPEALVRMRDRSSR